LELTFQPMAGAGDQWVRVLLLKSEDPKTLRVSYEAAKSLSVESIRVLDEAFWVTDRDHGYVVVPAREGLLIPADSRRAFTHRFDTFAYEGCHMEMLGIVQSGAAVLVTWHD